MKRFIILCLIGLGGVVLNGAPAYGACLTNGNLTGGGCVPYSGATANVDLLTGGFTLSATQLTTGTLDFSAGSADILYSGGSLQFHDSDTGSELSFELEWSGGGFRASWLDGDGTVLVLPASLEGTECAILGVDNTGRVVCNGSSGSDQDREDLFHGWIVFMTSFWFIIWVFRRARQ